MKISAMLEKLTELLEDHGDLDVVIDTGRNLTEVEDVDLGASDEGCIIWCGDRIE